MTQYRKKPVVVEAFQMTKERRLDNSEWPTWLHEAWQKPVAEQGSLFCSSDGSLEGEKCTPLFIQTIEGTQKVSWGDYIVQSTEGEVNLCSADNFMATHEPPSPDLQSQTLDDQQHEA